MRKQFFDKDKIERIEQLYQDSIRQVAAAHKRVKELESTEAWLAPKRWDFTYKNEPWYPPFVARQEREAQAKIREARTCAREWEETLKRCAKMRRCGAKTQAGTPCQCKPVGKRRCRWHGGKSTGPRTDEGREAIRESNRRRAEARRAALSRG